MTSAGIDGDRIVTLWFGELNPVADNATETGRALVAHHSVLVYNVLATNEMLRGRIPAP